MILTPNQIGAAIYWCGSQFGPTVSPPATQDSSGHITQHIPKPGSPERTKIEDWLDVAIAVCLAESSGNSQAINGHSGASGLWQIMVSVHQDKIKFATAYWNGQRKKAVPLNPEKAILDPMVNTQVAAMIYQESHWQPWEAYTSGAYKKFLGHGKDVYKYLTSEANLKKERKNFIENMKDDAATTGLIQDLTHGLNPFDINGKDWSGFMGGIFDFLRKGALAVGAFLLGVVLIALALWAIISRTRAGKTIKSAAKAALP